MTRNRRTPARLTRALMGLLLLAVLLPVGMQQSEATFVAATANPGAQFTTAADLPILREFYIQRSEGRRRSAACHAICIL